jgi:hypothetical protein
MNSTGAPDGPKLVLHDVISPPPAGTAYWAVVLFI